MPSELIHNSARVLEFDTLRNLVRGYCSSPLGHARVAELAPSTDREWIERQQTLASEIREFRRVGGRFDFSALTDIVSLLEKSRIAGAALETTEIRDVICSRGSRCRVAPDLTSATRRHALGVA